MSMNRRDFIRANAVTAAVTAAAAQHPAVAQAIKPAAKTIPIVEAKPAGDAITWDKGVCRFCGTGCSVLVGVQNGRVVATQGDPDAPVNRGLNCIKGYFLSKIMYGKDRLTTPLMRKKGGRFDKNGDFEPVSWAMCQGDIDQLDMWRQLGEEFTGG